MEKELSIREARKFLREIDAVLKKTPHYFWDKRQDGRAFIYRIRSAGPVQPKYHPAVLLAFAALRARDSGKLEAEKAMREFKAAIRLIRCEIADLRRYKPPFLRQHPEWADHTRLGIGLIELVLDDAQRTAGTMGSAKTVYKLLVTAMTSVLLMERSHDEQDLLAAQNRKANLRESSEERWSGRRHAWKLAQDTVKAGHASDPRRPFIKDLLEEAKRRTGLPISTLRKHVTCPPALSRKRKKPDLRIVPR